MSALGEYMMSTTHLKGVERCSFVIGLTISYQNAVISTETLATFYMSTFFGASVSTS